MFGINKVLKNTDWMINYYEISDLISSLVTQDSRFDKIINNLNNEIKDKIENAALYLWYKKDKTNNENEFLKKYNKYILNQINVDIKNILNNKYCFSILGVEFNNCVSNEEIIKTFNMSFNELFIKLDNELEKISNKILAGIKLSVDEKKFYENNILFTVTNQIIFNEDNAEILKYFNDYPINDIDSPKNRQLYLVYMILKNVNSLGETICLTFNDDINIDSKKIVTFGRIGKLPDGRSIIEINNTDIYSIKNDYDFYHLIFILMHELGHFNQDVNYDKYSVEDKKRINMENKLRKIDSDFYLKYHNNFFIEQDANMYAVKYLLKKFDSISDVLIICKKELLKLEKVYSEDTNFYKLELEKYNKVMNNNDGLMVK